MTNHSESAARRDPEGLSRLSTLIRDWEPRLDLYAIPDETRIYEPDGVLYACVLSDEVTLSINHREKTMSRGDLVVVPQALAIEMDRPADLLCIRYDGPPPIHFRERFLQVWGFEPFPIRRETAAERLVEVLPAVGSRHRIGYSVRISSVTDTPASGYVSVRQVELRLFVGLSGSASLRLEDDRVAELSEGRLHLLRGEETYRLEGSGEVGIFSFCSELEHEARLRSLEGYGPEYP